MKEVIGLVLFSIIFVCPSVGERYSLQSPFLSNMLGAHSPGVSAPDCRIQTC